jgi:hypothetical protein
MMQDKDINLTKKKMILMGPLHLKELRDALIMLLSLIISETGIGSLRK